MALFTGSAVALITPFTSNDEVAFDVLTELIEFHIREGTDALIPCGTTGEPSTMTADERKAVIAHAIKVTNGRIPVIAGTGGNCTRTVIEDSQAAEAMGADGLLIVTPYYNKCTQKGLVAHYHAIADAVNIPIIVYNVPGRTGLNILPETMRILADHPRIIALKEASGNIEQVCEIARLCPDIDLYSGNDDHIVPLLSMGGKGVISVLANIMPRATHDIVAAFLAGNVEESRRRQLAVNALVRTLFCEVNPIPVKRAVALMGFDVGALRLPLTPLEAEHEERLRCEMQALQLI